MAKVTTRQIEGKKKPRKVKAKKQSPTERIARKKGGGFGSLLTGQAGKAARALKRKQRSVLEKY